MTHLNIQQGSNVEIVTTLIILKLYEAALSVSEPLEGELDAAYMSGNLLVAKTYRSLVEYLTNRFDDLSINVTDSYYIPFEDPIIGSYCASHYGDGIGTTESLASNIEFGMSSLNVSSSFWGGRYYNEMTDALRDLVESLNDFLYFTHSSIDNGSNGVVYGFHNATSVKFPNKTFGYYGAYSASVIDDCKNIETVDYRNAIFVSSGTRSQFYPIRRNDLIENWSDSLLPKQTSYENIVLFEGWRKLKKVLFPEGKTHFYESWQACASLLYVEYPSTTVSMGNGFSLGRDSGHRLPCMVVKAVIPPTWYGWDSTDTTSGNGQGLGWSQLPIAIYVPDNSVTAYTSITSNGTTNESMWANPAISALIKPMSEIPLIYRDMGTVTQADIDRV